MNWYLEVLKKYAVFDGRARKKEYWMFFLFHVIIMIALVVLGAVAGSISEAFGYVFIGLLGIYVLGVLLPVIGVTIRRLHDSNRSGWWILIQLVPYVGPIAMVVLLVFDGTPGDNKYGPNPVQGD